MLGLSGCGGGEQLGPEETVREFIKAADRYDGARACKLYTDAAIERAGGRDRCEAVYEERIPKETPRPSVSGASNVGGGKMKVRTRTAPGLPAPVFCLLEQDGELKIDTISSAPRCPGEAR